MQLEISWQWMHKLQHFCIPGCLLIHLNIIIQHRQQSKFQQFLKSSLPNIKQSRKSSQGRRKKKIHKIIAQNVGGGFRPSQPD